MRAATLKDAVHNLKTVVSAIGDLPKELRLILDAAKEAMTEDLRRLEVDILRALRGTGTERHLTFGDLSAGDTFIAAAGGAAGSRSMRNLRTKVSATECTMGGSDDLRLVPGDSPVYRVEKPEVTARVSHISGLLAGLNAVEGWLAEFAEINARRVECGEPPENLHDRLLNRLRCYRTKYT